MEPRRARRLERILARGELRKVRLESRGGHSTGEVAVRRWTRLDRTRRALAALALFWALAALSILLPVAHFFLVPGLFVLGPVVAWFTARQTSAVLGGRGLCPACGQDMLIEGGTERWPLEDVCESCRVAVTIELC